jgi:tRNA1Val (adenine37-N6)-methyltransferase
MSSKVFKFKQFEVDQTGCAMKINTDGVLLAALAEVDQPQYILDIGTGTGVIALMLAQRFKNAQIHAVEIDEAAALTASTNFGNSIYAERLTISNTAIQQFNSIHQFDLIVSNPPYFVNDLKNPEEKKGLARHTDQVFFEELLVKIDSLLSDNGAFWFVLPVKQSKLLAENAMKMDLYLTKLIHLHSDKTKPEFRRVACLTRKEVAPIVTHFYIYESEKVHTIAYRKLLKDFFLRLDESESPRVGKLED